MSGAWTIAAALGFAFALLVLFLALLSILMRLEERGYPKRGRR